MKFEETYTPRRTTETFSTCLRVYLHMFRRSRTLSVTNHPYPTQVRVGGGIEEGRKEWRNGAMEE